jgi:hypothetical protein
MEDPLHEVVAGLCGPVRMRTLVVVWHTSALAPRPELRPAHGANQGLPEYRREDLERWIEEQQEQGAHGGATGGSWCCAVRVRARPAPARSDGSWPRRRGRVVVVDATLAAEADLDIDTDQQAPAVVGRHRCVCMTPDCPG